MRCPSIVPCVLHEDDHLLVVNKPPGWNTHAPSPHAGEGIYDWLRQRVPRWADLAIIHRLDKETSGVLVFSKTTLANQNLTRQFAERQIRKQYWLLTDRTAPPLPLRLSSHLVRDGDRYRSRPRGDPGTLAETTFQRPATSAQDAPNLPEGPDTPPATRSSAILIEAHPATGRTHQIRVHAAAAGFPILGDRLYGGTACPRLCLHAAAITLRHPATNTTVTFCAQVDWNVDPAAALRRSFIEPSETDAYRVIHGAADGWPEWYVDRLGSFLLSQAEAPLTRPQQAALAGWMTALDARGVYHKRRSRHVRESAPDDVAPRLAYGEAAPAEFVVRENGLRFGLRLDEGYSVGLFLDQRDNRRRLLTGHIASGFPVFPASAQGCEVLNLFAYTCAFSVAAARAGARVTSIDVSRKYLAWGQRNFLLNQIDPAAHDFIYGDVFDWLRRLRKRGRQFDLVIVDPPTFSTTKTGGRFRAEADWPRLAQAALAALKPGGRLFASTNAARLTPARFLDQLATAIEEARRQSLTRHYAPQPPDFPACRSEPAHFKSVWMQID